MVRSTFLHPLALLLLASSLMQACGPSTHTLVRQETRPDPAGIAEPAANEVVVMINNNSPSGTHAGIFAGSRLNDPSGTYVGQRSQDKSWPGPSLSDYVAFQKEDGERIQLYRFRLAPEQFKALDARMAAAGPTAPLFCAVEVNNLIAGLGPFEAIRTVGWISPAELGRQLDELAQRQLGKCEMPGKAAC
jgi:hypothetical protein